MSKKRLIPKLLLHGNAKGTNLNLVITKKYTDIIEVGSPVSMAKIFQAQGADELIFTNIDSKITDLKILADIIDNVSEEIFMPITVGGGVKSISDFRLLLNSGADKISINTIALTNPELITQSAELFGAQCVVVSIDYKQDEDGNYWVYSNGGKIKTNYNPIEWAIKCEQLGAGEILLSSIDNDGMRNGLNNEINHQVSTSIKIPVIASGGCSLPSHFIDGFKNSEIEAIAAGTFFALKDQSFQQIRSHIKNAGIPIRIYS